MKRKCLVIILFLSVALLFTGNVWATIECCCKPLTCTFVPWFGPSVPVIGIPFKDVPINECYYFEDEKSWMCEERLICIAEIDAEDPLWYLKYKLGEIRVDGICDINLSDDDCESESLLGADHPGLDILRQFRDEVLSKSEKGIKLIDAYYKYGDLLIKAFEANPALEIFAIEILEKTIERLLTAPDSDEELLTDDIAADIEILADELDMVVVNPGLKKTLRHIKGDMKRGKMF